MLFSLEAALDPLPSLLLVSLVRPLRLDASLSVVSRQPRHYALLVLVLGWASLLILHHTHALPSLLLVWRQGYAPVRPYRSRRRGYRESSHSCLGRTKELNGACPLPSLLLASPVRPHRLEASLSRLAQPRRPRLCLDATLFTSSSSAGPLFSSSTVPTLFPPSSPGVKATLRPALSKSEAASPRGEATGRACTPVWGEQKCQTEHALFPPSSSPGGEAMLPSGPAEAGGGLASRRKSWMGHVGESSPGGKAMGRESSPSRLERTEELDGVRRGELSYGTGELALSSREDGRARRGMGRARLSRR